MDNEELVKLLEILNRAKPGDPPGPIDDLIRMGMIQPRYRKLVDRVKRDELAPDMMNTLLAYARDPDPTPGRTFARKVLSEAWRDDDAIH